MRRITVAAACPPLRPANVPFNLEQIKNAINQAKADGVSLLILPELALSGCSCGDLFFSELLQDAVVAALRELCHCADGITLVVGAPLPSGDGLCNCACLLHNKKPVGIVAKSVFSASDPFGQARHFTSADTIELFGRNFSLSPHQVFDIGGVTLAVSMGADAPRVTADIIAIPDAAPAFMGSRAARQHAVNSFARDAKALCIYASAGEDESTADFVCSGHLIISRGGVTVAESEGYVCGGKMIVAAAPISDLTSAGLPPLAPPAPDRRYPFIPADMSRAALEILEIQAAALARRLKLTGCRPVIGISGGLDSTHALLIAVSAVQRLGRPASDVLAITMPCFGTSGDTLANALRLMEQLGTESRTIPIGDSVKQHLADISHPLHLFDAAYENAQARERTQVLMDVANMVNGLVIGTGDMSELALGWCTYNGDQMSMYSVNATLPKTLIQRTVRALADAPAFAAARETLIAVVDQPISPELLPPDAHSGKIAQKTEDIVGPYELHDFFIYHTLSHRYSPAKIFKLALAAFKDDYAPADIKHWLVIFTRRFFTQQFKRSCAPDGVSVSPLTLSPRGGWAVPSDTDGAIWRAEAENIKV